jgi:hypothetical protein
MSEATSPWYGFTKSNGGTWSYGYDFGANAVYPAAGYRLYSNGSVNSEGSVGSHWTASPYRSNSSYASDLHFSSIAVYVDADVGYRTYGLSVRCVKSE